MTEKKRTGLMYSEEFNEHNPCAGALLFPAAYNKWLEQDDYYDNPKRLRPTYRLLVRSGLAARLAPIAPRMASEEELLYFHTPAYLEKLKTLSEGAGGSVGPCAWVGHGSYDVIRLAVGGDLEAVDAVMRGDVRNAFCLQRPPGAHACRDEGFGFCIVNCFNIMAEYARRKYGLRRILIVDFDNHYKMGVQQAWYDSPEVLYAEIHQTGLSVINSPHDVDALHVGEGAGRGYNVPIPMTAGAGDKAYLKAFREIIEPIADQYRPELVLLVAGYASNICDPLCRQQLTAEGYRAFTGIVIGIAERHCEGRLVAVMEGGQGVYMPFCVLRTLEALSGKTTEVDDPIEAFIDPVHGNDVTVDQERRIAEAKRIQSAFWKL